ncbi:MAG: hypothetical protein MR350_04520 [Alphaproteobacteria bacterium]|nr:hypothetical protein [Alphaproteobacteria bacterium]
MTDIRLLSEQKREAEISALMQEYLPVHLKSKVTDVNFNGKCAYHKEIQGELLEAYQVKNNYSAMDSKQRHQLASDIAELLALFTIYLWKKCKQSRKNTPKQAAMKIKPCKMILIISSQRLIFWR